MTERARQTYERVSAGFVPPNRGLWRADLALGSGLTALAVEAALRDLALLRGGGPVRVIGDPLALDRTVIDAAGGRVLGCSFSARSSEVLDGLARLRARGLACDLHGTGSDADLPIPAGMAARPVQHIAFCATVPALVGTRLPSPMTVAPAVAPFLRSVAGSGRVPLFVGDEDGFRMRLLLSYWLEYMQRPGFRLVYPDFTHNFLWAGARTRMAGYAYVLEPPTEDLSDHRFRRLVGLLHEAGAPVLVLPSEPTRAAGDHVGLLLAVTDEMRALATECGHDLQTELTFDCWWEGEGNEREGRGL